MTGPALSAYHGRHAGEEIVVCGCGTSLKTLVEPQRYVTIGVNDVGRLFDPTYLVVVNPRTQLRDGRFLYVEQSNAKALFTQLDLGPVRPPVVHFKLGQYGGTEIGDGGVLHYTQNSPYVAACLAAYMGARRIGLIGVDLTDDHFFARTGRHSLAGRLREIDGQYGRLAAALAKRGIELVNLSALSRLAALPRMRIEASGEWVPVPNAPPQASVHDRPHSRGSTVMRIAIEKRSAGLVGDFLDALAKTAARLGHAVTRDTRLAAFDAHTLSVVWNGRAHHGRGPTLYCEHGWLPRSDYQVSPRGINAASHVAPFVWDGAPLSAEQDAALDAHLASIKSASFTGHNQYMQAQVDAASDVPAEFLLVPLQIESDTNIIRFAPKHLRTMQGLIDYVSKLDPPWPVLFKQHPADLRRGSHQLRLRVRRPQDMTWPHARGNVHQMLKSGACRGVITINSNVAHDCLLWDVPAVVLGRNVWPSAGAHTPFLTSIPSDWSALQASVTSPEGVACRRAYAHFLMTNRWTLADARDAMKVSALLAPSVRRARAAAPPPLARRVTAWRPRPAPRVARRVAAQPRPRSGPTINVVAEDRGWLFEAWKREFAAASWPGFEVVVSEKPLRHAEAWIFIRAREAGATPDPSRTVVQLHDLLDGGRYQAKGERACVSRCAGLSLTHPGQEDVLMANGIALADRRRILQPVGWSAPCDFGQTEEDTPSVAWIGRPAVHDGTDVNRLDWFVEAVRPLRDQARAVLVGEGVEGAAAALRRAGVDCRVHGLAQFPPRQATRWLGRFDCVVMCGAADSGPWPLFDSVYAGVPVVAAPVGWASELLADGTCGRLAGNPAALSEAVGDVLAKRADWRARRVQMRERVEKFSLAAWVQGNLALAADLARREHAPVTSTPNTSGDELLRLDVGCGEKLRRGHVGVDIRPLPGVKIVCNAWELDRHVAAGSVHSIYCRHFFEHLTFAQGKRTLLAFRRVLRAQGRLHIIVPEIRYHMKQYLQANPRTPSEANKRWSSRQHALAGFWGWQREGERDVWDVHKAGYDESTLTDALAEAGFKHIRREPEQAWHLSMTAIAE